MTETITLRGAFQPKREKLAELMAVMEKAVAITQKEPGVIVYQAWLSEDSSTLHWTETYRDSAAALAHLQTIAEVMPAFLACVNPTGFTLYGAASDALKAALAPFGVTHMKFAGGFSR